MRLRMAKDCFADMDQQQVSAQEFKRNWGCSVNRPARILNVMPHLWRAEGVRTGMAAAPGTWTEGTYGVTSQHKDLEAAVRRTAQVDPLLVDAIALPLHLNGPEKTAEARAHH